MNQKPGDLKEEEGRRNYFIILLAKKYVWY
jgi:hypothetical protein